MKRRAFFLIALLSLLSILLIIPTETSATLRGYFEMPGIELGDPMTMITKCRCPRTPYNCGCMFVFLD